MATTHTATIVGTGLIGRSWAVVFARAGWSVQLYARTSRSCDAALQAIHTSLADLHAAQLLSETPTVIAARIQRAPTLAAACQSATLVQENIVEELAIKQALFAKIDALAPPEAILASSASWLPASRFTETLPGRHRCLVAHPANPPHLLPLVELCPAPWTTPAILARANALYTSLGQQPVHLSHEIDGFLLNRIQGAVLNEMLTLFENGVASAEDLDRVMTHGLGLRWSFMGPFATIALNAPAGVPDYARRYGPSYARLGQSQRGNAWAPATLASLATALERTLPTTQLTARARWRDARLMALRAHQAAQADA